MTRGLSLSSLAAFVASSYTGEQLLALFWGLVVVGVEVRFRLSVERERIVR